MFIQKPMLKKITIEDGATPQDIEGINVTSVLHIFTHSVVKGE
jgi:hypothetical protein